MKQLGKWLTKQSQSLQGKAKKPLDIFLNKHISYKLTSMVMLITSISLIVACVAFIKYDIASTKQALIDEMNLVGEIIGKRSAPVMQFVNEEKIRSNLEDLKSNKSVILACVYSKEGDILGKYNIRDDLDCPLNTRAEKNIISNKSLSIQRVVHTIAEKKVGYIYIRSDMREINNRIKQIIIRTGSLAFIILFLAFIFTQKIQKLISIPIQHLTDATKEIINKNDYTKRAKVLYKDEIGSLAKMFNKMLRQIQNRDIQLRLINGALEDRVAERTKALEYALQAKSNFLSNMSHEIRTPNHAVMNCSMYVESFLKEVIEDINKLIPTIADKEVKDKTQNILARLTDTFDFNDKVRKASERQAHLLNNILDLSKMGEGKLETNMQPNELYQVVESVLSESEGLYKDGIKDIKVVFNKPKIKTEAEFDYQRMSQVISNLFGNAIKYSDNGTIEISIKSKQINLNGKKVAGLMFSISDQGLGIPPTELKSIFEKFTEGSHTKKNSGGTGIGLSICLDIIAIHNGDIWAQNNKVKGSTFSFVIPKKQPKKDG